MNGVEAIKLLTEAVTDWNGEQMADGEYPRDGSLTCGQLRSLRELLLASKPAQENDNAQG